MGMIKCHNGFTGQIEQVPWHSPTNESLRSPGRYWIVSDAQLARDLRPRTLRDIYRENARGRRNIEAYRPKAGAGAESEYRAWCKARGHVPHPASLDSGHSMHVRQRFRCPRPDPVDK